jgi:hypothetical protein
MAERINALKLLTDIERLIVAVRLSRSRVRRFLLNWRLWRLKRNLKRQDVVQGLTPAELILVNTKVANIRRLLLLP